MFKQDGKVKYFIKRLVQHKGMPSDKQVAST